MFVQNLLFLNRLTPSERNQDNCILRLMKERAKHNKTHELLTKKLPPVALTAYPAIGIGLIGYIITCDLPYLLPVVYIAMIILIQVGKITNL